jgi:cytochrome c oxidase assembly protein subunit 15
MSAQAAAPSRRSTLPDRSRAVAVWLFVVAVLVFAMVIVGGATRLTGSGLSITEWRPVSGALPPLSTEAWLAEFHRYQQIPQFRAVNPDMTLQNFKGIYWWEWSHRLLGRAIGFVFLLPLIGFLALRRIPRRLIWRCVLLFGLGGLQGLVGWWMVASGLVKRVSVAPERLTMHLSLALLIFCFATWTGLEAWAGPGRPGKLAAGWARAGAVMAVAVFIQIMMGGLVAGNHAGQVFNDWPLMAGRVFPADFAEGFTGLAPLLHSQAAVQFDHRIGAYLVFAGAIAFAVLALRSPRLKGQGRSLAVLLAVLVTGQLLLGIATLMAHAPLHLSLAHQCLAALVLATAVSLAWRLRRA